MNDEGKGIGGGWIDGGKGIDDKRGRQRIDDEGRIDGWKNGWNEMEGWWMDGTIRRMDGLNGWIEGWMRWMDAWNGWMDAWNGWMERTTTINH